MNIQTPHVDAWTKSGRLWLWRYTENSRDRGGWHLTGDDAGCASLVALLDAFAADGKPATRAFELDRTTERIVCVPNFDTPWAGATRLRITFSADPSAWSMPVEDDPAHLVVGATWLPSLHKAVAGIPQGEGDFTIGPKKAGRLWIWWKLDAV